MFLTAKKVLDWIKANVRHHEINEHQYRALCKDGSRITTNVTKDQVIDLLLDHLGLEVGGDGDMEGEWEDSTQHWFTGTPILREKKKPDSLDDMLRLWKHSTFGTYYVMLGTSRKSLKTKDPEEAKKKMGILIKALKMTE